MITRLNGLVAESSDGVLTLDVNGVGYGVQVPKTLKFQVDQKVTLHTALHWNQENGPSLYGFATPLDRTLFLLITSCSGIGPKIGLAILSAMTPAQFVEVVHAGDEKGLSTINGIGPKKAEQMIVALKHKIAKVFEEGTFVTEQGGPITARQEIAQVLKSLNYSKPEISSALQYLNEHYPSVSIPFDQLMRHVLGFLAKRV